MVGSRVAANSKTFQVDTPSDREIRMTRLFDAPRALVFEAMSKPEHVKRWWGILDEHHSVTVCEIDLRVGGMWRYVMVAEGFGEVGFHGEYREIVPNERLVTTEVYEGIPDAEDNAAVDILTLAEVDGRTRMTILVEHPTKEGRDAHIESGMEAGLQDALDLLEQVAVSLR